MAESAAFARRTIKGGAALAHIPGGLTSGVTGVVAADDLSSWSGATTNGPTRVMVDRLGATPEEIEISSVSGNNITIAARGVGNTTDTTHGVNATIEIVSSPRDFDEANYAVTKTVGEVDAANQFLVSDAANSLVKKTAAQVLTLIAALPLAGGTLTGDLVVPDEAYDATSWNGSLEVPTKNAVRDKIETLSGVIGALSNVLFVRKTTNESVTSSATMQDDDELTLAVAASSTYIFLLHLTTFGAAAGDIQTQLVPPSGATVVGMALGSGPAVTTAADVSVSQLKSFSSSDPRTFGEDGSNDPSVFQIAIVRTGVTAGNCKLQWAQGTSSGTATTVKADSFMLAFKVA